MKKGGKIKVLFLADCNENSIQAQDRGAKNWAVFLDPYKYDVSIFCKGAPDERLRIKDNVNTIYLNNKSRAVRAFKAVSAYLLNNYDVVIVGKYWSFSKALFLTSKYLRKKRKIVVSIVNQVPYEKPAFSYFKSGDVGRG